MFFCFLLTGLGLLLKLRLLLELLEGDLRLFLLFSRFRGIGLADVETLRPRRVGGEFLLFIGWLFRPLFTGLGERLPRRGGLCSCFILLGGLRLD